MKYSKAGLSIMLIPKIGRLVKRKGRMAQCIAQASEAVIPRASQLILNDISKGQDTIYSGRHWAKALIQEHFNPRSKERSNL